MNLISNTYYKAPNTSTHILVLRVLDQDENQANVELAYVTDNGHVLGMEKILLQKNNIKHWVQVPNLPFLF